MTASHVVSKTEFAGLCSVTPGRVSQWIADRQIKPDSMVGEGRRAKIDVARAMADLKGVLDPGKRTSTLVPPRIPERIEPDPMPDPADYRERADLADDFTRGAAWAAAAIAYDMPQLVAGALLEARVPMERVLAAYKEQRGEYANLLVSNVTVPLGLIEEDSLEHGPNTPKLFAGIALI